jgi:glycosyltransferase involved in cell wall biosynthesis
MYYLSVGAMFKNESHILKEWLEHYLFHGVDHFYLINDGSTDCSLDILQEYIDREQVTLFSVSEPYYLGRQRNLYNQFILPRIKETKWLLMIDLDEFVWSKKSIRLDKVLKEECEDLAQIQIQEALFGSNGYETQPNSIVPSFTKRQSEYNGKYKYFINTSYDFSSLNIHHANFTNNDLMNDFSIFIRIFPEYFIMNHYNCQSREFWEKTKCTRGDGDNYLVRLPEHFINFDFNDVEDVELYKQNLPLYIKK